MILRALAKAAARRDRADPYRWTEDATDDHRREHGCGTYPYHDGSVLGAIAEVVAPGTVLELGAALGYTACWWATRAGQVDTVEADPLHVRLASENAERAELQARTTVHEGDFREVLPASRDPTTSRTSTAMNRRGG